MLKFDSEVIDELIDGGLENGEILFVFGEPNAGKSLLAYQMACQYRSIFINTEVGTPEKFDSFLKLRFKKEFKKPIVLHRRSLNSFMKTLGLDLKLVLKGGSDEDKMGKTESEIRDLNEFPLLDYLSKNNSELLVVDSLTTPIKGAIGSSRQNFGARANIFARIMGQLSTIIDELNIGILITTHVSRDKTNKYDQGRIWGGDSIAYHAKYVLQLSTPAFKSEGEDKVLFKRVKLTRFMGKLPSKWIQVPMKKDWGFK